MPSLQTMPAMPGSLPDATHEPPTQHAPPLHMSPAQHGFPGTPQTSQRPPVHMPMPPPQAVPSAMHMPESQQPESQEAPGQHG
jgi:hypothetical protein